MATVAVDGRHAAVRSRNFSREQVAFATFLCHATRAIRRGFAGHPQRLLKMSAPRKKWLFLNECLKGIFSKSRRRVSSSVEVPGNPREFQRNSIIATGRCLFTRALFRVFADPRVRPANSRGARRDKKTTAIHK